jgi:hypothetical protein
MLSRAQTSRAARVPRYVGADPPRLVGGEHLRLQGFGRVVAGTDARRLSYETTPAGEKMPDIHRPIIPALDGSA